MLQQAAKAGAAIATSRPPSPPLRPVLQQRRSRRLALHRDAWSPRCRRTAPQPRPLCQQPICGRTMFQTLRRTVHPLACERFAPAPRSVSIGRSGTASCTTDEPAPDFATRPSRAIGANSPCRILSISASVSGSGSTSSSRRSNASSCFRLSHGLVLTSVPRTELQGQPLPILAQRVEQQQALRCRHRPLAAACRVRSFCVGRKRTAGRRVGPVTLRL